MEMLYVLTVTDEEALKSLEIYLTRFKLKELELTNLFFKALKEQCIQRCSGGNPGQFYFQAPFPNPPHLPDQSVNH